MTNRTIDLNGWIEIKGNPISKEDVFDYLGSEIGAPDPNKIYKVYRPASELTDPECLASFKLLPFVDEHTFLGSEDEGATPAERKGIQGVIGEQVYFDPPYLRGNLKILSESVKNLISSDNPYKKIELSPGYKCFYEFTSGVFNGKPYDAIQRHIRGNHLALVEEGRTGPDVAIMDHHFKLTIDSAEILNMAEITPESGGDTSAQIKELLAQLKPLLDQQAETNAILAEFGLGAIAAEPVVVDEEKPAATDAEVVENIIPEEEKEKIIIDEEKAMDSKSVVKLLKSLDQSVKAISGRVVALETSHKTMDADVLKSIAGRDELANRVSHYIGTFDSSSMTKQQVAEYAVGKLGINTPKGTEAIALDAYMQAKKPESEQKTYTADSSNQNTGLLNEWETK